MIPTSKLTDGGQDNDNTEYDCPFPIDIVKLAPRSRITIVCAAMTSDVPDGYFVLLLIWDEINPICESSWPLSQQVSSLDS
jgi:hypothetical protein